MERNRQGKFSKKGRKNQLKGIKKAAEYRRKRVQASDEGFVPIDHDYIPGQANDEVNHVVRQEEVSAEFYTSNTDSEQWRVGRRVVELGALADGLKGCELCGQPLHLTNCVAEKKFGLAHILQVKCMNPECNLVNDVPTGSKHVTPNGGQAWDVNTKLAAGMINGGFGETHVNSFLASLNIPGISKKSLKNREREVGVHLEELAEESCQKQLQDEIRMSNGNLTVGFDGAWQKRGTGHAYNSLTGHATLFGEKTKKCLSFSVKGKKCRICSSAKLKGVPPRKHKCSCNWTGSAKSMEPALACEMIQSLNKEGTQVKTLIMDNDSTTVARVKATVDSDIEKRPDKNHTRKSFTSTLYELSRTHKELKNNKLRNHIEKCFMYCISQNRDRPEELKNGLMTIVPHLFGEHELCGPWCRNEKKDYKPRNLPYGKPLTNQPLRNALETLFSKYAAKANELAAMGSTQINENFNHMVASKAPKRLYYGGSESLKSRVSATVCQKNDGYNCITELNKKCSVSPGRFTLKHVQKMANKLKKLRHRQSLVSFKRRRLELKFERSMKDSTQSVLEGETYQSQIGLLDDSDLQDITLNEVKGSPGCNPMIFFDLETTGLARTSDIIQIAAASGLEEMSIYMRPTTQISLDATAATGLTCVDGVLKCKGQIVPTVSPKDGLCNFLDFLKKFEKPILIGHNVQNYDIPVLVNQLAKYGLLEQFRNSVSGFIDTLKLAKKIWKKGSDVENFKQETLIKSILKIDYDAHNAVADVTSLQNLYEETMAAVSSSKDVFTLLYYACKSSLDPLLKAKAISSQTLKKLVGCSLSLSKLMCIHKRDPHNGIRNIFSEYIEGSKSPRVSKSNNVIAKVVDYLNAH